MSFLVVIPARFQSTRFPGKPLADLGGSPLIEHVWRRCCRAVDAAEGYGYSGALEQAADVWTPENLYAFLEDPRGYAPGNKMSFSGLKKPEDRADLIAYLDSLDN